MRLTFDSNVLIYSVDADAPAKRDVALDLLRRAALRDNVLLLQTLGEFTNVMHRRRLLPPREAAGVVADWLDLMPVVAAQPAALHDALGAHVDHHLPFWDAMLWATAKAAGCRFVLTEDFQDGRKLGGVTFLDPFQADNARVLDALLPAD